MRKATLYPLKLVNCIKVLLVRHEGLLNWMKCEYFSLRDVCHSLIYKYIITARQRSCGKVVFSQVSVILFTGIPT